MSSSKPQAVASAQDIASLLRQALTSGDSTLSGCRPLIATFALKSSPEMVSELEEYLQEISMSIDQSDIPRFAGFLDALHLLIRVLSPSSIITAWFDIVLRSAFRTPKLPRDSVRQAKELVLHGLSDESHPKTKNFRRMLIDLYLLDVHNESSKDDVMEHVALDPAEQQRQRCWKTNLEETLLADSIQRPKAFFSQIDEAFQSPRSRLQLVVLLSQIARIPELSVQDFADSTLFASLLLSLQLDRSTTLVSVGISVLVMMLPQMATKAPHPLNSNLPRLLCILSRVICWKERHSTTSTGPTTDPMFVGSLQSEAGTIVPGDRALSQAEQPAPGVDWVCLESSFDLAAAPPPDARLFFQFLYGLWPTNTLSFLRRPIEHLTNAGIKSPYIEQDWEEVIDVDELRSRAKPILRTHVIHPSIMLHDSTSELSDCSRWEIDVSGLVSECISLDVRNAATSHGRHQKSATATTIDLVGVPAMIGTASGAATPREAIKSVERAQEAAAESAVPIPEVTSPAPEPGSSPPIQELVANHVVLKSSASTGIGLDFASAESAFEPSMAAVHSSRFSPRLRPRGQLFADDSASPSHPSTPRSPPLTPPVGPSPRLRFKPLAALASGEVSEPHALEVISSLQREVLLLRNELNFELWLKKQHLSHMKKLHQDRIAARSEEAERQTLHIRLKQNRLALQQAQEEIKNLKAASASATARQNEWTGTLQAKLAKYRDEKRSWANEATELRGEVSEAKNMVAKQKEILDETETERFRLQTELAEVMPKVEKIHEYEQKIDNMTKRQILWDDSPEMREFREQKSDLDSLVARNAELEMMVQSLEGANQSLEELNNEQRKTMRALENRAVSPSSPLQRTARSMSVSGSPNSMSFSHERFLALETEHLDVKGKNRELEEKVEELEAMVEILRHRESRQQRRGSVATLSASSVFGLPGSIDLGAL